MPIDRERIRARLKELSASEGGSLVMRRTDAALSGAARVLFVGPASEGPGDDVPLLTDADMAAFGYRSVCFPRDEMATYCADKVFTMVYDVWKRAFSFDQRYIDAAADACGIGSLHDIYRSVCRAIRFDPDDLRIKPGDTVYPVCHFRAPMDANSLSYTISAAGAKAQRQINALKLGASVTDAILSTVKSNVESPVFLRNYGPYGGLVLLNGREDAGIHGFIGHIASLRAQLPREIASRQWALAQARNRVEQAAVPLTMDRIFYNDKIEEFINACWGYSLAMFEEAFYRLCMDGVLRAVSAQLEAYAHETCDIYVPVMDTVRDILARDAAAFAEGTLHRRGEQEGRALNAYALSGLDRDRRFESIFESFGDMAMAKQLADELTGSMYGSGDSRARWEGFMDDPAAMADELRRLFGGITGPVAGMTEKLLVAAYGRPAAIDELTGNRDSLTFDDVNALWDDENLRACALRSAAHSIVGTLAGSLRSEDAAGFPRSCFVRLPGETPDLNAAVEQALREVCGGDRDICTARDGTACEYRPRITMMQP